MTDYERDLAAGGKPVMSDYERDLAAGGKPVDAPSRPASTSLRGMRPEPKPDDDAEPVFAYHNGNVAPDARSAQGTDAYAARHSGDEMNDPGAQALTGAAMAAPLAAVAGMGALAAGAGRVAPLIAGASGGAADAAMQGGNPIVGAMLGAIPGSGGALRATDDALGRAALARAATVGENHGLEALGRRTGTVAGLVGGGHHGGVVEALAGGHFASKAGAAAGRVADRVADRVAERLADRYLARTAQFPETYSPPTFPRGPGGSNGPTIDTDIVPPAQLPPGPSPLLLGPAPIQLGPMAPRAPLAPLVSSPGPLPASAPNGAFGTPFLDDFGVPVTRAGQGGFLPTDAPTGAGRGPLRADVMRSIRENTAEMPAPGPPSLEDTLGADLAKSVQLLDDLRGGRITAKQAIAAGLPARLAGAR